MSNNLQRRPDLDLDPAEKSRIDWFREVARDFMNGCDTVGKSRDLSLAKTHMEDAFLRVELHMTKAEPVE